MSLKLKPGDRVKIITGEHKGTVDCLAQVFGDKVRLTNTRVRKVGVKTLASKKKTQRELGLTLHRSNVLPVTKEGEICKKVTKKREGKDVHRILHDGTRMLGDLHYLVNYTRRQDVKREKLGK